MCACDAATRSASNTAKAESALAALDAATERAGRAFLRRLEGKYPLIEGVVFGSRARGDHRADSDADVAVILRGKRGDRYKVSGDMAEIAFDVMLETGVFVDPLPLWEDELRRPEQFSNPALIANIGAKACGCDQPRYSRQLYSEGGPRPCDRAPVARQIRHGGRLQSGLLCHVPRRPCRFVDGWVARIRHRYKKSWGIDLLLWAGTRENRRPRRRTWTRIGHVQKAVPPTTPTMLQMRRCQGGRFTSRGFCRGDQGEILAMSTFSFQSYHYFCEPPTEASTAGAVFSSTLPSTRSTASRLALDCRACR